MMSSGVLSATAGFGSSTINQILSSALTIPSEISMSTILLLNALTSTVRCSSINSVSIYWNNDFLYDKIWWSISTNMEL
jgi:hypothetical protein